MVRVPNRSGVGASDLPEDQTSGPDLRTKRTWLVGRYCLSPTRGGNALASLSTLEYDGTVVVAVQYILRYCLWLAQIKVCGFNSFGGAVGKRLLTWQPALDKSKINNSYSIPRPP